jgi:hypothetical protein
LNENKEYGLLLKNLQQFDDLWESDIMKNKNDFMNRHEKVLGALLRVIVNNVDRFNYHSCEYIVGVYSKFCMDDWDVVLEKLQGRKN